MTAFIFNVDEFRTLIDMDGNQGRMTNGNEEPSQASQKDTFKALADSGARPADFASAGRCY